MWAIAQGPATPIRTAVPIRLGRCRVSPSEGAGDDEDSRFDSRSTFVGTRRCSP
jgi:hypothetical protein